MRSIASRRMLQQAPAAPRRSQLGPRPRTRQRRQRCEITANVGLLLGPRPAFDAPLGGDGFVNSLVAFRMHERHRAPGKSVAVVKAERMLADALFDGTTRKFRVIAPAPSSGGGSIVAPSQVELLPTNQCIGIALRLEGQPLQFLEHPSRCAFAAPQDEGSQRNDYRTPTERF